MRSVTDWQKSSRERKHIADVLEEPPVSTCTFRFTLETAATGNLWPWGQDTRCGWDEKDQVTFKQLNVFFFFPKSYEVVFSFNTFHFLLCTGMAAMSPPQIWVSVSKSSSPASRSHCYLCAGYTPQQEQRAAELISLASCRKQKKHLFVSMPSQVTANPSLLCQRGTVWLRSGSYTNRCERTHLYSGEVCVVGASNKNTMFSTQTKPCPSNALEWCLSERLERLSLLLLKRDWKRNTATDWNEKKKSKCFSNALTVYPQIKCIKLSQRKLKVLCVSGSVGDVCIKPQTESIHNLKGQN